jgi:prolipoprotein diacylglyceryltransferase
MTRGQLLCLPMIVAGLAMFVWAQRRAGGSTPAATA